MNTTGYLKSSDIIFFRYDNGTAVMIRVTYCGTCGWNDVPGICVNAVHWRMVGNGDTEAVRAE